MSIQTPEVGQAHSATDRGLVSILQGSTFASRNESFLQGGMKPASHSLSLKL